ncbi:MAG: hypothetical protein PHP98_02470 [Kiritimatiellae bacterium]|jgi:hypothetical protein|nr:hypothetical protein [Kiritimatiellia bacterium]
MTIITALALTGCLDEAAVQTMESNYAALSNEIASLRARMTAVEDACLQLNMRAAGPASRPGRAETPLIFTAPAAEPAPSEMEKNIAVLSESAPEERLTRSSFDRLVGMTISEVLTMLGPPDKTSEEEGAQHWHYSSVRLATKGGGLEATPALIVFEKGCVARAVLAQEIKRSSEPKE